MHARTLKVVVGLALPVALAGCWNATRQYNKYVALGQQRSVPLVIYNTSWNDVNGVSGNKLIVSLVPTGNTPIASVGLKLGTCSWAGGIPDSFRVSLAGPFVPGRSYLSPYIAPAGTNFLGTRAGPRQFGLMVRRFVIQGVTVTEANGSVLAYRENVAELLAPTLANYCPLSTIAGN